MIEPTDEMVRAYAEATGISWVHLHVNHRAGLAAVGGVVARDRCMERRGHVYHPLARPQWPSGRGGKHPHFCASCSDGEVPGPGCDNCRSTGMDQTPWPSCGECAR